MSVSRWIEVAQGRGGDGDDKGVRNYTRTWKVITDDRNDTPATIFTYAGCPQKYSPCPWDSQAKCLKVSVRNTAEDGDSRQWEVTASYSSKYDDQQQANPLERPIKRSMDFSVYRKVAERDIDGVPITNSAGDKPSEPVEIDAMHPIFRFVRNEASIPVDRALEYYFATNSDTFNGAPAGTCRITIKTGEQQTENEVNFYQVTYEVEYRSEGWDVRYLNQGFNSRTAAGKKIKVCGDQPRLLHAEGNNPDGKLGHTTFTNTPEFCRRKVYNPKPFNSLGL